ncbi:MAG TPA: hypothetical protein VGB76_03970 [Pyrinomonadaceae bacterium]|jgi:hypothetical protein
MFCPSCGIALPQQLKYCNRCGAQLNATRETELVKLFEKRMESEMEGLFWIIVFGLGLLLGGLVILKKGLGLGENLLLAYMILCSTVLLMYFGLGVWQVRRLARSSREASGTPSQQLGQVETNELNPATTLPTLEPVPSVIEQTTRTLEPAHRQSKTGGGSAY